MCELPDSRNCFIKSCRCRADVRAAKKGSPLHRFCPVVRKFVFKADRPRFDRRCAMIKRSLDCPEQGRSIKIVQPREAPTDRRNLSSDYSTSQVRSRPPAPRQPQFLWDRLEARELRIQEAWDIRFR